VALSELVSDVASEAEATARTAQVRLEVEVPEHDNLAVLGRARGPQPCPRQPGLAVGVVRSMAVVCKGRAGPWTQHRMVAVLALSGVLAALVADFSGLSKAETERIWLSFGVIAYSGLALLRGRRAGWALATSAAWALLVNHLLNTGW
jgi:hypothetical protein